MFLLLLFNKAHQSKSINILFRSVYNYELFVISQELSKLLVSTSPNLFSNGCMIYLMMKSILRKSKRSWRLTIRTVLADTNPQGQITNFMPHCSCGFYKITYQQTNVFLPQWWHQLSYTEVCAYNATRT